MPRFVPDSTNNSIYFQLLSEITGLPLTGVAYDDAGAAASYTRPGSAHATITLATLASAGAAHSDGGFIEVSSTSAPGLYRLDVPDAAFATGVTYVIVSLKFDGVIASSTECDLFASTALDAAERNRIADHVWRRNNTNIEASSDGDTLDGQSPYGAVARLSNGYQAGGPSTMQILKADKTTVLDTHDITKDASADPITAIVTQ